MLTTSALEKLAMELSSALAAMGVHGAQFGKPELVEQPVKEAERIFQGYAKAKPSKEDAYAAARAFLRGQTLDTWQKDLIASAIAEPIREQGEAMVLGNTRFRSLLSDYEAEASSGDLWRLTWHGLLYSYFNFDLKYSIDETVNKGWLELRAFLERTWPLIDKQAGDHLVPDWISVLRKESVLLSDTPTDKYADAYLAGDTTATEQLAADLGIPPTSWFWHALVLGAVKRATQQSDNDFQLLIPQLIKLIQVKPGFRDEAIELILDRYHKSKDAPQNELLRDFVCQPTVWKNPKLKSAGIATAWTRVSTPVWQMVLNWVNEGNLKDFFDILAARNKADEGRLAFWSKYLKQIQWTRLIFSADTMALKNRNADIRDLIAREEGAYAELGKRDVDAFMMQIGSYVIIEFSKKPNACYAYKADELPFPPYARHYSGGSEDLAAGYNQNCAARIVHTPGWANRATEALKKLHIYPDVPDVNQNLHIEKRMKRASPVTRPDAVASSTFNKQEVPDIKELRTLLQRFSGASIDDRRVKSGGRLWVEDPSQRLQLGSELKKLGFKWANSRQAWYYPEN